MARVCCYSLYTAAPKRRVDSLSGVDDHVHHDLVELPWVTRDQRHGPNRLLDVDRRRQQRPQQGDISRSSCARSSARLAILSFRLTAKIC